MAIEAPVSRYRKTNLKIYVLVCAVVAVWFAYDGYINESFIEKHTVSEKPDPTLVFNRHSPFYFGGAAIVLAAYLWAIKDKKIVADEKELRIGEDTIKYDAIESIDKTYFAKKGYFVIAYKDAQGKIAHKELSDRNWDHLAALLDHLVAKIS